MNLGHTRSLTIEKVNWGCRNESVIRMFTVLRFYNAKAIVVTGMLEEQGKGNDFMVPSQATEIKEKKQTEGDLVWKSKL